MLLAEPLSGELITCTQTQFTKSRARLARAFARNGDRVDEEERRRRRRRSQQRPHRRAVHWTQAEGRVQLEGDLQDQAIGAGELYVYDAAVRIDVNLGLRPNRVFLHAGTRAGARALGLDHRAESIAVTDLPRELRRLPAGDLEDLLCIYKDELAALRPSAPNSVRALNRKNVLDCIGTVEA